MCVYHMWIYLKSECIVFVCIICMCMFLPFPSTHMYVYVFYNTLSVCRIFTHTCEWVLCLSVCVYWRTQARMQARTHSLTHARTHARAWAHTHIDTRTQTHTNTNTNVSSDFFTDHGRAKKARQSSRTRSWGSIPVHKTCLLCSTMISEASLLMM